MSDDVQRDLGKFEAQIEALQESVAKLQGTVEVLAEAIQSAKGGWRTLMWLGGAASVLGASLFHLFDLLLKSIK